MKPTFFATAADFRRWLAAHHANSDELLVGFYKRGSKHAGMTYREALDQALAHGWIDGVRKRLDDDAYTIRFTPRKPGSVWSVINTKRVEELIDAGQMKAAGLRAFRERDPGKTRQYSYEREHATLSASLLRTLRGDKQAFAFFESQPPGYKKIVTFWIMSAKRDETRARRLAHLIARSREGERIDLLTRSPGTGDRQT
jgi:uncharacterized protein YdeI (YjbR/CyaY-like superfamily)